jgi:Ca-activated chloride channel family protein
MTKRLNQARQELRNALSGLQPHETFDIVAFSDDVKAFRGSMVPANAASIKQAHQFLDELRFVGGTNLSKAMERALSRPGVNLVVVITDGVPSQGLLRFKSITREIRKLNTQRARIFTIGLVGKDPFGEDRTFEAARLLEQISKDSGGEFKIYPLG